jgi:hypothetical protein
VLQQSWHRRARFGDYSHHKDHQQGFGRDYPVYDSHLRQHPLVNHDQRNVLYHNSNYEHVDSTVLPEYDPFGCLGDVPSDRDLFPDFAQDAREPVWDSPPVAESSEEEAVEDATSTTTGFPDSFFMNPFAVSFPGDIPYPPTISTADSGTTTMPAIATASDQTRIPSTLHQGPAVAEDAPSSLPSASTPSIPAAYSLHMSSAAQSSSKTPKSPSLVTAQRISKKTTDSSTAYGSQIYFVDMTDKKGAQRIRNTMNSRKHRQNKLDRIRDLEKRLVALAAEKEKWQERAEDLGWRA